MSYKQLQDMDFGSVSRVLNLLDAVNPQEPATLAQLNSVTEGLAWKDSVRVSTQSNINLASPGAAIDGITMAANDRFLAPFQTTGADNGIYSWNGAATPATRTLDANTFNELEQAVVTVEEGTSAGVTYRQTVVNGTIGVTTNTWTTFGTASAPASEITAGIAEIATQAETDTGTDDTRIVSPLKLAASIWAHLGYKTNIGDGASTQYVVTHNLNTRDIHIQVVRVAAPYDNVGVDQERTSVNTATLRFSSAPALNAYRVLVTRV